MFCRGDLIDLVWRWRFESLGPFLNERTRGLFLVSEAEAARRGGIGGRKAGCLRDRA
jgi:hypothetical protein